VKRPTSGGGGDADDTRWAIGTHATVSINRRRFHRRDYDGDFRPIVSRGGDENCVKSETQARRKRRKTRVARNFARAAHGEPIEVGEKAAATFVRSISGRRTK